MLVLNDITYRIAGRLLLDRASASIPARARVGFVGRNGTGKTTLFRLIAGETEAETGRINLPKTTRLGRVEQEAPGGPTRLVDFVLSADQERQALLAEAEKTQDPHRVAEIHTRLVDIDAHAAPARAAAILAGLGFDEIMQQRPLSEFSGGWRMRVALAAVLFSAPDLLLLDEPTNYLDFEGTVWLIDYLTHYPATVIVISHDRDLLDAVSDHVLHLDQTKLALYRGNYTSFARQRAEQQVLQAKQKKKQEAHRQHLQAFIDRFKAKASKARQAQSRLKMLARMESIDEIVDTEVLSFDFPSPMRPLSPPIVAMERVAVGYAETPVLSRLDLIIADDDRIGLLGANGNGKSTLAKLIANRLAPLDGKLIRAPKLTVGFFAQHQIDDLDPLGTALSHVALRLPGAGIAKVRAQAARAGFPASKAETPVAQLSGGEKARLLLALATIDAPHLLILDEPTNHLDIDSRAALIEAINDYQGAVILVSHDKYLLEACADRLWLVAQGSCRPFEGDLDDYRQMVLQGNSDSLDAVPSRPLETAPVPAPNKRARRDEATLRRHIASLEERIGKFNALLARIDEALADADTFRREPTRAADLVRQRREMRRLLERSEDEWLTLSGEIEATARQD
jgi:ATP-binding cassette subfamily F protein 3